MKTLFLSLLLAAATLTAQAQTRTLTGTILDERGYPVAGAAVTVPGAPGHVCITNAEGAYWLGLPAGTAAIRVAYAGYAELLVPVASTAEEASVQLVPVPGFELERSARVVQRRHERALAAGK